MVTARRDARILARNRDTDDIRFLLPQPISERYSISIIERQTDGRRRLEIYTGTHRDVTPRGSRRPSKAVLYPPASVAQRTETEWGGARRRWRPGGTNTRGLPVQRSKDVLVALFRGGDLRQKTGLSESSNGSGKSRRRVRVRRLPCSATATERLRCMLYRR